MFGHESFDAKVIGSQIAALEARFRQRGAAIGANGGQRVVAFIEGQRCVALGSVEAGGKSLIM